MSPVTEIVSVTNYLKDPGSASIIQFTGAPPVFKPGRITPFSFVAFERACKRFFDHEGIPDKQKVSRLLYCFDNAALKTYVAANEKLLVGLTFDQFIHRLRDLFLPREWDGELARGLRMHQNGARFEDWVIHLQTCNSTLAALGSKRAQSAAWLREHIRSTMHPEMVTRYNDRALMVNLDRLSFEEWMRHLREIANSLETERKWKLKDQQTRHPTLSVSSSLPVSKATTTTSAPTSINSNKPQTSRPLRAIEVFNQPMGADLRTNPQTQRISLRP